METGKSAPEKHRLVVESFGGTLIIFETMHLRVIKKFKASLYI